MPDENRVLLPERPEHIAVLIDSMHDARRHLFQCAAPLSHSDKADCLRRMLGWASDVSCFLSKTLNVTSGAGGCNFKVTSRTLNVALYMADKYDCMELQKAAKKCENLLRAEASASTDLLLTLLQIGCEVWKHHCAANCSSK